MFNLFRSSNEPIQNQPSSSSNGSEQVTTSSPSDPSPQSASAGPASSQSPQEPPQPSSPPPPSSYHPTWRADAAPSRLSYKSFSQTSWNRNTTPDASVPTSPDAPLFSRSRGPSEQGHHRERTSGGTGGASEFGYNTRGPSELGYYRERGNERGSYRGDYPSWLPRRPPPPAPASTIGTNTPMPPELGEIGEFEKEYREYLRQIQGASTSAPGDIDADDQEPSPGIVEGNTTDLDEADIDYLRNPALLQRQDSTSGEAESPVDAIPPAQLGGRKPTPRSVRIVNLEREAVAKGLGVGLPSAISRAKRGSHVSYREGVDGSRVASDATQVQNPLGHTHAKTHSQSNWYANKHAKRISSGSTAVHPRGYTRATAPPTTFHSVASAGIHLTDPRIRTPKPRFNAPSLHLELLQNPSLWMKVYFRIWPVLVLGHLPVQAFFDFNAVYMLLQVSRYPLPTSSPSSPKNWALCAAAYIASWLVSVLVIFVLYELVYSFARRWRVRRPRIYPLYLSAPGYNYACMTSYNVFCFMQHLRWTAFVPVEPDLALEDSYESTGPQQSGNGNGHQIGGGGREEEGIVEAPRTPPAVYQQHGRTDSSSSAGSLDAKEGDAALGRHQRTYSAQPNGRRSLNPTALQSLKAKISHRTRRVKRLLTRVSWRDGLSETFNLYSQNLPNVLVLLPRAGIALGLVLAFNPAWDNNGSTGSLGRAAARDTTFFRSDNGLLTSYALGVLWANVAWTAWRVLVLLGSWIGLWILSGHGCAGICGPRDKWEEEEHYRLSRTFSNSGSSSGESDHDSVLPWEWRECTKARVQDAWEFCLVGGIAGRYKWGVDEKSGFGPSAVLDEKRRSGYLHQTGGLENGRRGMHEDEDHDHDDDDDDDVLKRVLAAVGLPSVSSPAKRPILRQDLFDSPSPTKDKGKGQHSPGMSQDRDIGDLEGGSLKELPQARMKDKDQSGSSLPLLKLPYPFTKPGSGQVSSSDLVPFPKEKERQSKSSKGSKKTKSKESGTSNSKTSGSSSTSGSESSPGSTNGEEEEEGEDDAQGEEDDGSSSHRYSEEPSTPSGSGSRSQSHSHSTSSQNRGRASNSLSSLGHPIPATFGLTSGIRSLSTYSPSPPPLAPAQRIAQQEQVGSASGSGSPLSRRSDVGAGNTRFPFLSGPPVPSHHVHGLSRVGGKQSTSSSTGHSRGLSQVSGMSGISGMSLLSTGTGAMSAGSGYAASGSAGAGMSEEGGMSPVGVARERNESGESGSSSASKGSEGLPMPPRHPQARSRTRSRAGTSPSSSSNSSPRFPQQEGGVAFPSVAEHEHGRIVSGKVTPPNAEDLELGLGVLAHENVMRAIRGRYQSRRMGEDDGESLQLSLRDDDNDAGAARRAPGHDEQAGQDDNADDIYEDDDEEVQGEREDVVGLLGTASGNNSNRPSPRASLVGLHQGQAQGSDTNLASSRPRSRRSSARSRESSRLSSIIGGRRPLSLSLVGGAAAGGAENPRSRNSSFNRQRREGITVDSMRNRASSFGVRIRERAHSLMQSVARVGSATGSRLSTPASPTKEASMSMTNLPAGGVTSAHRRLGSGSGESEVGVRRPEIARLGTSPASPAYPIPESVSRSVSGQSGVSYETGESSGSGSGSRSSSGMHPRHQQLIREEEAYYSSSPSGTGSHSRSGSESLSHGSIADNNYTFGRPMPFMQPRQPAERSHDDLSSESQQSDSPVLGRPESLVPPAPEDEGEEGEQFFSQDDSSRLASPPLSPRSRTGSATPSVLSSGMLTPIPIAQQPSFEAQQGSVFRTSSMTDSPPEVFLHPPSVTQSGWARSLSPSSGRSDYLSVNTERTGADSVMMLSSAAESFVTAPVSYAESRTTTTTGSQGSSNDTATISGSWEENRGAGGFVERLIGGTAATAARPQRGRRDTGMVERAGDVVGAGGNVGEGRVA